MMVVLHYSDQQHQPRLISALWKLRVCATTDNRTKQRIMVVDEKKTISMTALAEEYTFCCMKKTPHSETEFSGWRIKSAWYRRHKSRGARGKMWEITQHCL